MWADGLTAADIYRTLQHMSNKLFDAAFRPSSAQQIVACVHAAPFVPGTQLSPVVALSKCPRREENLSDFRTVVLYSVGPVAQSV